MRRYSRRWLPRRRSKTAFRLGSGDLFCNHAALDFSGRGARNGLGDVDLLRSFEVSQALLAKCENRRFGHRLLERVLQDDGSLHFLTPGRMGDAKAYRLGDGRMSQQDLIDFPRPDLLSAAIDELFDAAGESEITVRVE